MNVPAMSAIGTRARLGRPALLAALGVLAALSLVYAQLPAGALTVAPPTTPVIGNSTYFDGLGSPYGGCGLPPADLESQDFVALNVYDTPGDYTFYPRPIPDSLADKIGMWDNGHNCGRWVQVKISDYCTGTNDGAAGLPFCRNGSWVADAYNGATLNMLVADSGGDSNAWCRDDPYHLDLAKASLNRFALNGVPVGDMYPNHYNNRHIEWSFIPAPGYTGDIQIGFLQGAQRWWPAISVSRLANGIHGVEYLANGAWQQATMNGDMGQSYIIGGTTSGGTDFRIRVRDASDTLINNGRVYSFTLPDSCSAQCSQAYTRISYTTGDGSVGPTASVTSSAPSSASPSGQPVACAVTTSVVSAWTGGYQAQVTVRNDGTVATTGWTVGFSFAGTQTIANYWNAAVTTAGQQVTAQNVGYNGAIPAGGSATWGMVVNGADQPLLNTSCAAR